MSMIPMRDTCEREVEQGLLATVHPDTVAARPWIIDVLKRMRFRPQVWSVALPHHVHIWQPGGLDYETIRADLLDNFKPGALEQSTLNAP